MFYIVKTFAVIAQSTAVIGKSVVVIIMLLFWEEISKLLFYIVKTIAVIAQSTAVRKICCGYHNVVILRKKFL